MAKLTKAHAIVTIGLAAGLALVTGCTARSGQDSPNKPEAYTSPSSSASAIDLATTPPDISGSTKALVRLADRTGSEEVAVIATVKAGTVAVATECAGEGKTVITIGELATYTISCGATPSTTYNEIGLGSSKQHVKITVTASAGIRWGLSVGWRPGYQRPSLSTAS
ncbi:hypothetical protein ACIHIX_24265 [Streptomyces sp. NPDC051913]|uniref:hypothetical protein n=1 Tax=Streptomyces sp. NPDC051913 TaxID=3365676 RepID=UPI0037D0FF4A